MVQVDENSNGTEINLTMGEMLEIRLAENRTTGYKWSLESSGNSLAPVSDSFQPSPAIGQPGSHRWQFRAERAGSFSIELSYRRSWGEKTPTRTHKLSVRVS